MLHRPQFKPHLRVTAVENEGTFVLSELGHHVLTGPLTDLVVPLIDGERTADAIADELLPKAPMEHVYYTLAMLRREGHLVESSADLTTERAAFWSAIGCEPALAEQRLRAQTVAVRTVGAADGGALRDALAADAIAVTDSDAHLTVVVTDDAACPELEAINAAHLASGRPWLMVKPGGIITQLGPLYVPGVTGCWECLAQRLRANREVEAFIERKSGKAPQPVSVAQTAATAGYAVALAAAHVAIFLGRGDDPTLAGTVVTTNLAMMHTDRHLLVRRPQCPACGEPNARTRRMEPVRLRSSVATLRENGARGVDPETTLARYAHHVSPVTGVVTALTPSTGPGPLHVYVAGHNFAFKNDSLYFLQQSLRTMSSGKGRSDAQARTSALCEALERYSGNHTGYEVAFRASAQQLGDVAIDPNACMLFSERQFAERDAWLARAARFQMVPVPFRRDAEIEWSPAWSLTHESFRFLPTGYLYYGYPLEIKDFAFWADSNGNAAGNTLEEAILQGFLELVERDSVAVWWYNRLSRPAIDPASFDEPYYAELRAYFAEMGREFWLLDLTTDTGIPAVGAISRRIDSPVEDIIFGFGAHLDVRTAVMRAVTEMNQFMPAVMQRNPDGTTAYMYGDPDALAWWTRATVATQPYLLPSSIVRPRWPADYRAMSSTDPAEDVRTCVRIARALGLETLVVDQTQPDIGLPVAKVLVPGLRHFWARFAPGRLYDVPVRTGQLFAPLDESALNPIPLFI